MKPNLNFPLVIGHKGASKIEPENTLRAFSKAIEFRADFIEFDIHKTIDNEIVIIHDDDILRTTGKQGLIKEMTLINIKKLDAGKGETIPTLRELARLAQNKIGLQVEIKAFGLLNELVEILQEYKLIESSIISCFAYDEIIKLKDIEPRLKLALLLPEGRRSLRMMKRATARAINSEFYAIHPHYSSITKEYVDFVHSNRLKIIAWTVNEKNAMQRLIEMEIDGIITDDIIMANNVLGK